MILIWETQDGSEGRWWRLRWREREGDGWRGELPAADGSQSQWGMEGDPAVTLKQQVEAIIRPGTGGWMSPHTLISLGPSGPPESSCACVCLSRKRAEAWYHNFREYSHLLFISPSWKPLLFHRFTTASPCEGWAVSTSGRSLLMDLRLPFKPLQHRSLLSFYFVFFFPQHDFPALMSPCRLDFRVFFQGRKKREHACQRSLFDHQTQKSNTGKSLQSVSYLTPTLYQHALCTALGNGCAWIEGWRATLTSKPRVAPGFFLDLASLLDL